jgi:hypothetical protein
MSLPRVAHHAASVWARRLVAVEPDRAVCGRPVGQEAHQRERGHGFARAAFADEAEDLALRDVERDAAQDRGAVDGDGEVLDVDHGRIPDFRTKIRMV